MDCAVNRRHFDLALHDGGKLLPNWLHRLAVRAPTTATQDLSECNLPDYAAVKIVMKLENKKRHCTPKLRRCSKKV